MTKRFRQVTLLRYGANIDVAAEEWVYLDDVPATSLADFDTYIEECVDGEWQPVTYPHRFVWDPTLYIEERFAANRRHREELEDLRKRQKVETAQADADAAREAAKEAAAHAKAKADEAKRLAEEAAVK